MTQFIGNPHIDFNLLSFNYNYIEMFKTFKTLKSHLI